MKTILADYNAMTEAGHVCLTTHAAQEGIVRPGLGPGDWAWLSDTEVMVRWRNWLSTIAMGWSASRTGTRSFTWTTKGATTSTASRPSPTRYSPKSLPRPRTSREFLNY